jgi:2-dehydro-3-deoxyphosphooctonate aldolase (KDO 8-P synthase)
VSWSFARHPFVIAGPCVIEPGDVLPRVAAELARLQVTLGIPICFKASFDKANRARLAGARGPGLDEGLKVLERIRRESGLPILTDIHDASQAAPVAQVVDVLQIPAFLSRQTDLLIAAGKTGKPVNVKKGQWMAPEQMAGAVEKVQGSGAKEVAVTERGTFFGYGDLVVDMRSFARMREATRVPVIFDATHSVQQPGQGGGGTSGGLREFIPALIGAAAVAGADGFFLETHPDPAKAPSDAATQWPLDQLEGLLERTLDLWHRARA